MRDDVDRIVTSLLVWKAELVFADAGTSRATKVQDPAQQKNDKEWENLLKQLHQGVYRLLRPAICLLLLLPLSLSLWVVILMMETTLVEKHTSSSTSEEHLENVVWVYVVLSKLLLIPLIEVIFSTMLIINLPLFGVAEASKCRWNLLKSILGIGSSILVRMKLECQLPIGFLDVIFAGAFSNSQDFIVVLLCND